MMEACQHVGTMEMEKRPEFRDISREMAGHFEELMRKKGCLRFLACALDGWQYHYPN